MALKYFLSVFYLHIRQTLVKSTQLRYNHFRGRVREKLSRVWKISSMFHRLISNSHSLSLPGHRSMFFLNVTAREVAGDEAEQVALAKPYSMQTGNSASSFLIHASVMQTSTISHC